MIYMYIYTVRIPLTVNSVIVTYLNNNDLKV
jgi:hypothetical protein